MYQSQPQILVKLLISSIILALLYGYSQFIILKVSSILILAIMIKFYNIEDNVLSRLLFIAVLFHCIGDLTIEIAALLSSIPFFLIGHLLYCIIISRDIKFLFVNNLLNIPKWKYFLILIVFAIAVIVAKFVLDGIKTNFPDDIKLYYGVAIYISVLIFLSTFSIIHPACVKFLFLGVLLYAASDTLIAYHELIQLQIPWGKLLPWFLYYGGQVLIIFSLLRYKFNNR